MPGSIHGDRRLALITHAHADHARAGSGEYWAIDLSEGVLRQRLGQEIHLHPVRYGEEFWLGQCKMSFHSAGHVLGSAQIRLEADGEVWVISGDYKRDHDPSCDAFEPVPCDVLITEATFDCRSTAGRRGRMSPGRSAIGGRGTQPTIAAVLLRLRRAQRLPSELRAIGVEEEVLLHGAVETITRHYREAGVPMTPSRPVSELPRTPWRDGWCWRRRQPTAPAGCAGSRHRRRPSPPDGWRCVVPTTAL